MVRLPKGFPHLDTPFSGGPSARYVTRRLACSVLALSLALPVVTAMPDTANAQGFLQRLFNPDGNRLREKQLREQETTKLREKVRTVHVSAPKYFTYKPDRPVAIDLSSLSKLTTAAIDKPAVDETVISDATANSAPTSAEDPSAAADGAAPAVNQAPSVDPVTVQLSEFDKARSALEGVQIRALKEVGEGLIGFYREHPNFVWIDEGAVNSRADAVMGGLAQADAYGLDPQDYQVEKPLLVGLDDAARANALMTFEMSLSAAVLTYVLDAERGRVAADRISGYHDLPRHEIDLVAALNGLAGADNVLAQLVSHQPDNAQFQALAAELARLRAQDAAEDQIVIAPNTFLRPGMSSPELKNILAAVRKDGSPELLDKHADAILAYQGDELYTPELVALVKGFQKENSLSADGVIGKNTIRAMVGETNAAKISKVELAMERLRWLPEALGDRRVFINQPAFTATYYEPGTTPLSMRVVVGKKSNQTNFFYDTIEVVEYNPYWGVPYSIIVNEMLPKLANDPSYLDRAGYEVSTVGGRKVSSASVDWYAVASKKQSINVRQYPGPQNALGELKILFPNKHHIYMHDTPSKSLFKRDARALSHGCVRLQDPRAMAAAVLGKSREYVSGQVAQGQNHQDKVAGNIPVYVSYFTAWPDDNGKVDFFNDVYDRDLKLSEAIKATDDVRG
ncbi:L,D-transpeptidase family protein [Roseibium sp. CAU 1637]|uniref:L,D-transpeptidase family protein n=1 Tax=Roseibium limicola TaxID=2816037 RepID=A0A939EPH1_9HYPH|nr:L,D-transpeptidase family protein [Roseibium limicola]MBO0346289.1 L,D-transpeptidase family protein [Roseibium limicola]